MNFCTNITSLSLLSLENWCFHCLGGFYLINFILFLNGLNVNVMQQYAVRELRSHSNKPNKVEHLPV